MRFALSIGIVVLIGVIFVGLSIRSFKNGPRAVGRLRGLQIVAISLLCYGGIAFFAQGAAAVGGAAFVGRSLAWPPGFSNEVLVDSHGHSVAPLPTCGRIQVYDADGKFLRGWFVDAGGGDFFINLVEPDRVEAFIARRHERLLYSASGDLLERHHFGGDFADLARQPIVRRPLHTSLVLWPFAHPGVAWSVALSGLMALKAIEWILRKPSNQPLQPTSGGRF